MVDLVELCRYSPQIVANGKTIVIDNSSAFRYKDDIPPLVSILAAKS